MTYRRRVSAAICLERHGFLSLAKFRVGHGFLSDSPQVEARLLVYTPLPHFTLSGAAADTAKTIYLINIFEPTIVFVMKNQILHSRPWEQMYFGFSITKPIRLLVSPPLSDLHFHFRFKSPFCRHFWTQQAANILEYKNTSFFVILCLLD